MSKTIEELDLELCNACASESFYVPNYQFGKQTRRAEGLEEVLQAQHALTTKIVAQKYEAIIEERVRETVEQRLAEPGVVHLACRKEMEREEALWLRVEKLLVQAMDELTEDESPARETLRTALADMYDY